MSLLGLQDYGSNSSSSSEESSSEEAELSNSVTERSADKEDIRETPKIPLPLPDLEVNNTSCVPSRHEFQDRTFKQSSVFYNPYLAEEQQKISALEQHVVLSQNTSENVSQDKGEKQNICWKFRKGKCRFGDRCKFSHDVTNSQFEMAQTTSQLLPVISKSSKKWDANNSEGEDEENGTKHVRKRRLGITDSLIPPKRALQAYEKQKSAERPWM